MKKLLVLVLLLGIIFPFSNAHAAQSYITSFPLTYDGYLYESDATYIDVNQATTGEVDYTHSYFDVGQTSKSVTETFSSSTDDGWIKKDDVVYLNAHDSASGESLNLAASYSYLQIGQYTDGTFDIYRGLLYFDTSSIPDDAYVTDVTFRFWGVSDQSTTDFTIVLYSGMPTFPSEPPVLTDYNKNNYDTTSGIAFSTSDFVTSDWNEDDFTDIGCAEINKEGVSKFYLLSAFDVNGTPPTNSEYVKVGSSENHPSQLIINYEMYDIYRGALHFDTSNLPENAEIDSATLYMYGKTDESDTNFDITVVSGNMLHSPLVAADYYYLGQEETSCGTISTSSFSTSAYFSIPLNATGEGEIIREGVTILGLRSSLDISMTAPSGDEYVSIWSTEAEYSKRPKLTILYTIPSLGSPTELILVGANVFDDFSSSGDQLIAIEYKCVYSDYDSEPVENPEEYFFLQLIDVDGSTILAQSKLPLWGHSPGSIYLDSDEALSPSDDYTIKIIGNSDKFASPEESEYSISTSDFRGSNLVKLDNWIVSKATDMATYYGEDLLESVMGYILSANPQLNSLGSYIFESGIPGLDSVRANMFMVSDDNIEIESSDFDQEYVDTLSGNFGDDVMGAFNSLAESWMGTETDVDGSNLGGDFMATIFWLFVMLMVAGVIVVATGNSSVGVALSIPMIYVGIYLGVLPLVIAALLGVGCSAFLLHQLVLRQT